MIIGEFNTEKKILNILFKNDKSFCYKFLDFFTVSIILLGIFRIYLINKFVNVLLESKDYLQHNELNKVKKCIEKNK